MTARLTTGEQARRLVRTAAALNLRPRDLLDVLGFLEGARPDLPATMAEVAA